MEFVAEIFFNKSFFNKYKIKLLRLKVHHIVSYCSPKLEKVKGTTVGFDGLGLLERSEHFYSWLEHSSS